MHSWNSKNGVYFIAEIGGNHEGDFDYAKRLTGLACDSGADAVKFQIYKGDSLVSKVESPDRNAHFKKFELSREQYQILARLCREKGVDFTASVWDVDAINWINDLIDFHKIGSGDLTAYPILRKIACTGKPLILSTGLSTMEEISGAVECLRLANPVYIKGGNLALLQCTSMYPIPDEEANLKVMESLKKRFNVTVGYSDHTVGSEAVLAAAALGAEIIEFHFTDTRDGKVFRDHKISFTQSEVKDIIPKIKKIRALVGSGEKGPTASEISSGHLNSFRRAVYPAIDLARGTVLGEKDLVVLRPKVGIDAVDYDKVLGRTLARDVKAFEHLRWECLD